MRRLRALVSRHPRSVQPPARDRGPKRPSSSTEAYFATDRDRSLLVVYHIQKTAGTALRELIRANLPPAELELADDLRDLRYDAPASINWHRRWYEALAEEQRARLCCLMSHSAGYLLPSLDRPAETLVLVREPVDRVLSFYWEKRRNFLRGRDPGTPFGLLEKVYAPTSDKPRPQSWPQFFNWQSRSLLSVYHDIAALPASDVPPPDADAWRDRLRELVENVFFVGVQDRFAEYCDLLVRRFGWAQRLVPRSGVNWGRPPLESVSDEMRETIRAHNWLDTELYKLARAVQERREAGLAPAGSGG